MYGFLVSVLLAGVWSPIPQSTALERVNRVTSTVDLLGTWQYLGEAADCELSSDGGVTLDGANVTLSCALQSALLGNVQLQLSAQPWRQRRITVSADLKLASGMSATFWLKSQQDGRTLMLEDDTESNWFAKDALDAEWQHREISLPIASDATQVSIGVLVQGLGEVQLRNVRLTASQPGAIPAEVVTWLDAALAIVKQQTEARTDLQWQVLEPQVRVLASGAQTTAEAYPALRFLLSQLGGHSLLLRPEWAEQLQAATADNTDAIRVGFALPDGARLILAREALIAAIDTRTASNNVQ